MISYFPVVTGSLSVSGSVNISGGITASGGISISGSIASASYAATASFVALAQSASNAVSAQTASFANTLTVAGNLTAQTLVVQTITSSVDFVTGSTRFGSILGNTHVFSGSVTMNPNGLFVSSSGVVGIGTINPSTTMQVVGAAQFGDAGSMSSFTAAPIKIRTSSTSSIAFTYSSVRTWSQGISSLGSFLITDIDAGSDRLVISSSGAVGIGTTNPSQKLEVSGSIKATNTMVMASPFMFRNKVHNGDMRIDQRYNGGGISDTNGAWGVDRFITYNSVGSAWSFQRSTTAPPGFMNSLLITSTTGGAIGAGNYGSIRHTMEGLNTYDLAWGTSSAKNVTVSFWVRSSVTGTYGFAIRNGNANNYGYVAAYTISSANTWTYINFTIPGPTSGTWINTTDPSLVCIWDLGAGTSYSQAAGSWISASEIIGLTGGVKFFTNSNATYYITGVQLEIGDVATPFETRPYSLELSLCERYLRMLANGNDQTVLGGWSFNSSTQLETDYMSPVQMRVGPTIVQTATQYRVNSAGLNANFSSAVGTTLAGTYGGRLKYDLTGGVAGQGAVIRIYQNGGYIALSAEI